jgi:hypothetical protein
MEAGKREKVNQKRKKGTKGELQTRAQEQNRGKDQT